MVTCTAEKEAEMNQLDCKNVQKTFAQLTQTLSTFKKIFLHPPSHFRNSEKISNLPHSLFTSLL